MVVGLLASLILNNTAGKLTESSSVGTAVVLCEALSCKGDLMLNKLVVTIVLASGSSLVSLQSIFRAYVCIKHVICKNFSRTTAAPLIQQFICCLCYS